ncbi:MAG: polysaccharide pyruvyl transferase family protein, partial [Bacteroidales bacterium]|nr:polysaccharide pyruvyl transferase family protein [Bacteroidales bacterium]
VNSEANNINERDYDYMREKFYTRYLSNDRVCIISKEHNSPQLKYLISKCKAFVGSRTHATIAAYSQGIPTIVIGYSIKSRGIYFDLFDDNDDYIYSSDNNSSSLVLIEKFCQMIKNAQNIKAMLHKRVKGYKPYYDNAMEEIRLLDARNN